MIANKEKDKLGFKVGEKIQIKPEKEQELNSPYGYFVQSMGRFGGRTAVITGFSSDSYEVFLDFEDKSDKPSSWHWSLDTIKHLDKITHEIVW